MHRRQLPKPAMGVMPEISTGHHHQMKRAEAYRKRLLTQGREAEEKAVRQAINLMKKDIREIMQGKPKVKA